MTKSGAQLTELAAVRGGGRGAATRQRIVTAAIEVAAARGWDGATTRQIAERARVNQALIHYHFGTKDRLLRVAFEEAMRDMFAGPTEALLSAPSLPEGAGLLVRALREIDAAGPAMQFGMEALVRSWRDAALRASMAALLAEFRALVAERIEAEQARGQLDPALDPVGTATALAALFDGLGLHLLIDPAVDAERTAVAVSRLLAPPAAGAHRSAEEPA